MGSIRTLLDTLDDAVEKLSAVDLDAVEPAERYEVLERLETARRRQVALSHAVVGHLEHIQGCPPVYLVLADLLRISRSEARRRLRDAEQLGPRVSLTGEPLPPQLPATARSGTPGCSTAST